MTTFIRTLLGLLVLTVSQPTWGQSPSSTDLQGLLWKIEGNGLDQPSYLYGTIHAINQDDFFLTEATKKAFDDSQEIVLELDMDDPQMPMQLMQMAGMPDGLTLDSLLSESAYQKLDSLVQKNMGVGIAPFKTWQPLLAYSLIIQEFIDGQMASYEQSFVQMAQEAEKEVKGLESVKEQIEAMAKIPIETQADYLTSQLMDLESEKELFERMVDLYKKQEIGELESYIVSTSGGDAFAEFLLKERNEKWIDRIQKQAEAAPTFFGVGAGHLAGEYGVINLLRKAGFTVTKVD